MQPPLFTYKPAENGDQGKENKMVEYLVPRPFSVFRPGPLDEDDIDPKSPQAIELSKRKATLRIIPEEDPRQFPLPESGPDEPDTHRFVMIFAKLCYEVAYGFRPVSVLDPFLTVELRRVLRLVMPLERRFDVLLEMALNDLHGLELKKREKKAQQKANRGRKPNKDRPRGRQHKKVSLEEELAIQAAEVRRQVNKLCRRFELNLSEPTKSFLQNATLDVRPDLLSLAQIDQRDSKRKQKRAPYFRVQPFGTRVAKVANENGEVYAYEVCTLVHVGNRIRALAARMRPHRRGYKIVALELG